jgi:hypothetical protein
VAPLSRGCSDGVEERRDLAEARGRVTIRLNPCRSRDRIGANARIALARLERRAGEWPLGLNEFGRRSAKVARLIKQLRKRSCWGARSLFNRLRDRAPRELIGASQRTPSREQATGDLQIFVVGVAQGVGKEVRLL